MQKLFCKQKTTVLAEATLVAIQHINADSI